MPGGDRTGPRGLGPGTGWGRGPCVSGRRFWRNSITKEEELKMLEEELEAIKKRIEELKK